MRHSIMIPAVLTALVFMTACRKDDSGHHVPKPEAWPRIEIPESTYRTYDLGGVTVTLNASADMHTRPARDGIWADIVYPQFPGATIYLSLLETDGSNRLRKAVENRRERMALNAGGAATEITRLESDGGWNGEIAVTHSSITTPVQILAHDKKRMILSGALYLDYPSQTSPDSIAPIVKAVSRDLTETLKHLGEK